MQLILSTATQFSNNLLFLTNRVARQLLAVVLGELEVDGWRPQGTHLGILADLLNADGIRQQDLAISAIKDKATITRGLQVLEAEGLVFRSIDQKDRRQKLIYITEKGQAFHQKIRPILLGRMSQLTQAIPPTDMKVCLSVLHQLYDTLQHQLASTNHLNDE